MGVIYNRSTGYELNENGRWVRVAEKASEERSSTAHDPTSDHKRNTQEKYPPEFFTNLDEEFGDDFAERVKELDDIDDNYARVESELADQERELGVALHRVEQEEVNYHDHMEMLAIHSQTLVARMEGLPPEDRSDIPGLYDAELGAVHYDSTDDYARKASELYKSGFYNQDLPLFNTGIGSVDDDMKSIVSSTQSYLDSEYTLGELQKNLRKTELKKEQLESERGHLLDAKNAGVFSGDDYDVLRAGMGNHESIESFLDVKKQQISNPVLMASRGTKSNDPKARDVKALVKVRGEILQRLDQDAGLASLYRKELDRIGAPENFDDVVKELNTMSPDSEEYRVYGAYVHHQLSYNRCRQLDDEVMEKISSYGGLPKDRSEAGNYQPTPKRAKKSAPRRTNSGGSSSQRRRSSSAPAGERPAPPRRESSSGSRSSGASSGSRSGGQQGGGAPRGNEWFDRGNTSFRVALLSFLVNWFGNRSRGRSRR